MSGNSYHYIDIQQALNQQVDKMLNNETRYQAGLFLKPAAKTPELSNLENLGLSKLTKALIVAEVIIYGNENEKKIVRDLYSLDQISQYIGFADQTLVDKAAHVNASRVVKATAVEEEGDEFIYGFGESSTRYVPRVLRR